MNGKSLESEVFLFCYFSGRASAEYFFFFRFLSAVLAGVRSGFGVGRWWINNAFSKSHRVEIPKLFFLLP